MDRVDLALEVIRANIGGSVTRIAEDVLIEALGKDKAMGFEK